MKPDMLCLHLDHIDLTSQVENPLSRIILNPELYAAAVTSKTISLPGSDIEDRQYQLNIFGLSLGSVVGSNIAKENAERKEENSTHLPIMGENPALEWNIGVVNVSRKLNDEEPLSVAPLLSSLDISLTVAPAIVSNNSYQATKEATVVSGITVEISITNDIFLYLSPRQMELLGSIVDTGCAILFTEKYEDSFENISGCHTTRTSSFDVHQDSGIDSETSTLFHYANLPSFPLKKDDAFYAFIPFEVLVTAGSVSFVLFTHEDDFRDECVKIDFFVPKAEKVKDVNSSGCFEIINSYQNAVQQQQVLLNFAKEQCVLQDTLPKERSVFDFLTKPSGIHDKKVESGYDGSCESSASNIPAGRTQCEQSGTPVNKTIPKIFPFLFISVMQPHAYMKCHPSSQKFEASCFDFLIKGSHYGQYIEQTENMCVPVPASFGLCYLETRPGELDEKTGIPPAFCTFNCSDYLCNSTKISFRIERPVKLTTNHNLWDQAEMFVKSLESKFPFRNLCSKQGNVPETSATEQNILNKSKYKFLLQLGVIEFSTTLVVLDIGIPHHQKPMVLVISVEGFKTEVTLEPSETWIRELRSCITVKDLTLKLMTDGELWPILFPLTSSVTLKCHLIPYFQVKAYINGETLYLNLSLKCISSFLEAINNIHEFFSMKVNMMNLFRSQANISPNFLSNPRNNNAVRQHWSDDLRKGSFSFIQAPDECHLQPDVHQIVFTKAQSNHPAAMTWHYPEPRTLTKIEVSPVPYNSTVNVDNEVSSQMVTCNVQYWDSLHHEFVKKCEFQLSETAHCYLDFPLTDTSSVAFSDIWRVVLDCPKTDAVSKADTMLESILSLSPLALAACMRIDSCYDSSLVPKAQIIASCSLLRIDFCTSYAGNACVSKFLPFRFDGTATCNQEFMTVTLEAPCLQCIKWTSGFKVDGSFECTCNVIEYRNLTMFPVFDPLDFQIHSHASYEIEQVPRFELEVMIEPCFMRVSQSVVHTLKYALQNCKQLTENYECCSDYMLPNYYIICNNTQESIRFGQANTDESIILSSLNMHAYSWRSHKCSQLLCISLECNKWEWSKAFSIDECGVQKITLENGCVVYVKIKALSNLQKQIIFEGSLLLFNLLVQSVHFKLKITDPELATERVVKTSLQKSNSITLVILPEMELSFSLNDSQCHFFWSKWLRVCKTVKNEILKLPVDEQQKHYIWIHIFKVSDFTGAPYFSMFLCPLFIIRNHLPFTLMKEVKCGDQKGTLSVVGKGSDNQFLEDMCDGDFLELNLEGNKFIDIPLSGFKVFPSSDCINLSDVKLLCDEVLSKNSSLWPYSDLEESPRSQASQASFQQTLNSTATLHAIVVSKTEVIVEICQQWKWLNTILINIKPWALFINKLNCVLHLTRSDGTEWELAANSVFTPPSLQKYIYLSIEVENTLFSSEPVWLLEENNSKSQVQFENGLPTVGSINIAIPVQTNKMFLFQLKSKVFDGMRVMTLLPLIQLKNSVDRDLHMALYTSSLLSRQIVTFEEVHAIATAKRNGHVEPLLLWENIPKSHNLPYSLNNKMTQIFYIAFCACDSSEHTWSRPLRLSPDLLADIRCTVAVPVISDTFPLVITAHKRHDLMFLCIADDPYPFLLLHNRTNTLLFYGQSITGSEDATVYEEAECDLLLPSLSPGGSTYYTFPAVQQHFPVSVDSLPKIHFGCQDKNGTTTCVWSPAIDINFDNQFVCIPDACYVRVSKERHGHTIILFIDVVNKIEFTAEDVRSRIGLANRRIILSADTDYTVENTNVKHGVVSQKSAKHRIANASYSQRSPKTFSGMFVPPFSLCLTVRATHVSVIICDEMTKINMCSEVLRLNIDDTLLYSRTNQVNCVNQVQEICMCFSHIQIDNQMDHEHKTVFDFPVILKPHLDLKSVSAVEEGSDFFPNKMREKAFMTVSMIFELSESAKFSMETISITCEPVSVFLEDAVYYKILSLYKSYIPYDFYKPVRSECFVDFAPDVACISHSLVRPLRIKQMTIDMKEVYLTIHASLKLYLSIESSLLKFHPFERQELFTNHYELGHIIVIHYLTGALFRAGWLVGALDLLGNPANFARAVGTGIADFIRLPYHGFLNGPRCFIAGLSHGAAALISGISSGAITCVTNLATSISRNMDLLSLDADHLARQELLRRQLPAGITGGLIQGLSGLGISLLGAVAGVVDHPLQVFISSSSPLDTAKGVVSGLGKGLIGVITKPVGGAAEFVSQAGHGLLQGAGWLSQPERKYIPVSMPMEGFSASSLKLKCKIVQASALGEVLLVVDATHVDEKGDFHSNVLLLTSEVLCVINPNEDAEQRTFALTEIKCEKSEQEKRIVLVSIYNKPEEPLLQGVSNVNDRVADYVQKNWLSDSGNALFYFQDDKAKPDDTSFIFFVHPSMKNIFLAMFCSAKRKLQNKGFPLC